jgi:signal transduction histidine kinase
MDDRFVEELDRHSTVSGTKLDQLQSLIEASKIVNSTLELEKLLVLILEAATKSIRADRGTLYLVDASRWELWSKIAQGDNMVEIRLPFGKGLAGHVAKTGETISIADAYNDPRFNPEIDKRSGYLTRNVLCMPLRDKKGAIIGVFQLLNKQDGMFTTEDESFIEALSIHAAIAIENARMAQEMVRNQSLSAVGRMASTVIHDIKNPMATMRMYAQVIKGKLNPKDSQMADDMLHEVDRFVAMTQEVLDFSRGVSDSHLESVDFTESLQPALRILKANLSKRNVELVTHLSYSGNAYVDIDKIERVFFNLAGNAADAMPKGGSLTIATDQQDKELVITFSDTGTGMPEGVKVHMFEPFFTHGKPKGTGLGLAIVKRIIDDHGGRVEVHSDPGKGTRVLLRIPLVRNSSR